MERAGRGPGVGWAGPPGKGQPGRGGRPEPHLSLQCLDVTGRREPSGTPRSASRAEGGACPRHPRRPPSLEPPGCHPSRPLSLGPPHFLFSFCRVAQGRELSMGVGSLDFCFLLVLFNLMICKVMSYSFFTLFCSYLTSVWKMILVTVHFLPLTRINDNFVLGVARCGFFAPGGPAGSGLQPSPGRTQPAGGTRCSGRTMALCRAARVAARLLPAAASSGPEA